MKLMPWGSFLLCLQQSVTLKRLASFYGIIYGVEHYLKQTDQRKDCISIEIKFEYIRTSKIHVNLFQIIEHCSKQKVKLTLQNQE